MNHFLDDCWVMYFK